VLTNNYLFILICFFNPAFLFASSENYSLGARQAGMSDCGLTISDVWSANHNQAALAYLERPSMGLFYENRFIFKELGLQAGSFALPLNSGTFALSLSHFGYSLYNESKIGLAYAKALGNRLSIGMQIAYMNTKIGEDYGNRGAPIAELGMLAKPVDNIFIGVHVFNLTRSKIPYYSEDQIPTILKAGLGLVLSEQLLVLTEIEKDLSHKAIFRTAIEYLFMEQLYLRAGVSTNPNQISFGLGYKTNRIRADIAFSTHPILGTTPHVGLVYYFDD